jgi:hypothetical protein
MQLPIIIGVLGLVTLFQMEAEAPRLVLNNDDSCRGARFMFR